MKKLRELNLEDKYMEPADFRFYTTDWESNGTSTLIIADQDNQIIAIIEEALFNATFQPTDRLNGVTAGYANESIWYIEDNEDNEELLESLHENTSSEMYLVAQLDREQVLESIAQSPVQTRFEVLRKIVTAIKGA